MLPPRTYELQSRHNLGFAEPEVLVKWATDALVAAYDSPSLRILAGLAPPFDHLEVERCYSATLSELGIPGLPPELHVRCFMTSILRQMLDKRIPQKDALETLNGLFLGGQQLWESDLGCFHDYELAYDFYLLYGAWDTLTRSEEQWDWEGANRSNIATIVDERAQRWLQEHATQLDSGTN